MDAVVRAFFSYAHADLKTAPSVFETFSGLLEDLVNSRLIGRSLEIWRDTEGLRTGVRWNDRIEERLRQSHVLIVMISPNWLKSEYCRKEYSLFRKHEPEPGEFVLPVLARSVKRQARHFSSEQEALVADLFHRQYYTAVEVDFLSMTGDQRRLAMEKLADDFEGMVERVCELGQDGSPVGKAVPKTAAPREFSRVVHNYSRVDIVSEADVVVGEASSSQERDVFAQVSFVENLYVTSAAARIDFGVRQAYLSVWPAGDANLQPSDEVRGVGQLVAWRGRPGAVTLAMEPTAGRRSLGELALPVSERENFYCRLGRLSASTGPEALRASLEFNLSAEGLTFFEADGSVSGRTARKIALVIAAAAAKEAARGPDNLVSRSVPVRTRT